MFNFRRDILVSLISLCLFIFMSSTFANPLKWIPQNSGTTNPLNSISYGNGRYVVTSTNGLMLTSADAINWSQVTFGTFTLMGVTYNPLVRKFIAVGNSGTIVTSVDGLNWMQQISGTRNNLNGIATNNGMTVVVGSNGTILYSTNGGLNWNPSTSVTNNWLAAVTRYDDGHGYSSFVAVGLGGVILQSTDGVRWIPRSSGVTSDLYGVAASANKIIAVGSNNVELLSTDGGVTWTQQSIASTIDFWGITYSSQLDEFAAVGKYGVVSKSKDGVTWITTELSGGAATLLSIAYINNQFITVGEQGTIFIGGPIFRKIMYVLNSFAGVDNSGNVVTSYDGSVWKNVNGGLSCRIYDMAFNYDQKTVYAFGSGCILKSTDLVNWTEQNSVGNLYGGICYGNHMFARLSESTVSTSSDGLNWNSQTISFPNLGNLACGTDEFVIVNHDQSSTNADSFIRSTDGFHWEQMPPSSPVGANYNNITYIEGLYYAVGDAEADDRIIMVGPDGIHWQLYRPTNRDGGTLTGIAFKDNGQSYVGIAPGFILHGTNLGTVWTVQPGLMNMTDVVYGNGMFVIIGDTILTSSDGIVWTDQIENLK